MGLKASFSCLYLDNYAYSQPSRKRSPSVQDNVVAYGNQSGYMYEPLNLESGSFLNSDNFDATNLVLIPRLR